MSVTVEAARSCMLLGTVGVSLWLARYRGHTPRAKAGCALALVWAFVALAGVGVIAKILLPDAWPTAAPTFLDVPVALLLAGALLAGPLPAALPLRWSFRLRLALGAGGLITALALFSEREARASLSLATGAVGAVLVSSVVVPAQALADWTRHDENVAARSTAQSVAWLALLIWILPSALLAAEGRNWSLFAQRASAAPLLWLCPFLIPLGLMIAAAYRFAADGDGTPFPYDPPKRLVRGGIYAYLANPMQVGICLLEAWLGVATGSMIVAGSALIAVLLFTAFANLCSGVSNVGIENPDWRAYRENVPTWWPRLRPWLGD